MILIDWRARRLLEVVVDATKARERMNLVYLKKLLSFRWRKFEGCSKDTKFLCSWLL